MQRGRNSMEGYFTLFVAAFLAATVLPAASELILAGLLTTGHDPFAVWVCASVANTLGSGVNWWLGLWALHYQDRRWFPFRPERLVRAQGWFARIGVWSLLLAWLPLIGDALTFVAGLMRVRARTFFALTLFGKATRYAMVIAILLLTDAKFGFMG